MKIGHLNPNVQLPAGSFCSNPCDGCPTANLIRPFNTGAAQTVDKVFTDHTAEEVRAAEPMAVYDWGREADQFETGFTVNEPIEFSVVYDAVTRIAKGECPQHQL